MRLTIEQQNQREALEVLSRLTSPEVAAAVEALAEAVCETHAVEAERRRLEATDY